MELPDGPTGRVLIYAPIGRDGPACAQLLRRDGLDAQVCTDMDQLLAQAQAGVLAFCITEEGLFGGNLAAVTRWVANQPPWSDPPFVVLTSRLEQAAVGPWREKMVQALGNVSLLERPVQSLALTTMVRTAARARLRQYQIHALLSSQEQAAAVLESTVAFRTRQLQSANAELREQMIERAQMEDSLRQAQKLEALGQLTGGVAHDFNNLLMVISGGLQMFDRQTEPARRQRLISAMQRAVERGAGLTRQLLTFARRQALQPQALDLGAQVQGMRDMLERSLRGDIEVVLELSDDLWMVEADPGELELVILNLAVNARDAMPGGGRIEIRTENLPRLAEGELRGDYVNLSITDSGTGMSPEVKARIFEPFFTTKDVGKGSGLGLPQAYGFATQSGGTVQIFSELGRGTTVRLLLPRSRKPLHVPLEKPDCTAAQGATTGYHVLLVEDDDEVAALTAEMLAQLGYGVTRAASPDAALGALSNGRTVDLVFSDIMMPGGMNGVQLAREIRGRRPDLPVVLTTGYPGAEARRAEADGIPLVPKPYRLDELGSALAALLAGKGTAAHQDAAAGTSHRPRPE
jgi:signal transduction histidine kinase/ActR/RegA family two-component response regulator